jgi:TonB family protein
MRKAAVTISMLIVVGARALAAQDSLPANVYYESQVTHAVVVTRRVEPAYPDSLRGARIGGRVLAQWVVDTTGMAERRTVRILKTPHAALGGAVRDAALAMRFRPADLDGKKVRQLVQMGFRFNP